MGAHALLSPSSAARWLACPPSARLEAVIPDTTSRAAEEGSLAHEIADLWVRHLRGDFVKSTLNKKIRPLKDNELFDKEMLEHCENYAVYVMARFNEARSKDSSAIIETESVVDLTSIFPDSFGTVDNSILGDGTLEITDFKYGKGVEVSAQENKQMMSYAYGCYVKYSLVFDIERVRMNIYQPRINNIDSFEMSLEDLLKWGEEVKPVALQAYQGKGDFLTGPHCQFCKMKSTCRAQAEENLELAKHDFAKPPYLSDEEINEVLPLLDQLIGWANDLKKYAFEKALQGHIWEGFKLVAGRSNRAYADEDKIAAELQAIGYINEQLYNMKLKGLTDMQKLVGKSTMDDLEIEGLIIKPEGKPTLVPASDKRPAIASKESAKADFEDNENDLI